MSAKLWQCAQGHHWATAALEQPALCPQCGRAGSPLNGPVGAATPFDSSAPTLAQPPAAVAATDAPELSETLTRSRTSTGPAAPEDGETLEKQASADLESRYPNTVKIATPGSEPESELPPEPDDQPPPGARIIGGHHVLEELGRGGMGVVYKARHLKLKRTTALKMIRPGLHGNPHDLLRFTGEARAVAQLHHPNIIQIFEIGEHEGQPFISLEYAEGGNLADQLGRPLKPRRAAAIAQTLAGAVHYAHQQGIVHRDLKPANVMQARDGTLKLTDFGLAKSLREDSNQTGTGSILGTPAYMAPEQAEGRNKDIGPAADTYALGAILYEMLTGRPPFVGESVLDTLQLVVSAEPVPVRGLQPTVPADLETICLKCLHKEPSRRYPSAAALEDDLRRFLAGEPIQARPVATTERMVKWACRHPVTASLVSALVLALTGGFIGIMILWLHAESERVRADGARQDAEKASGEAQVQRNAAVGAKKVADLARDEALEAKKAADQARDETQRSLYITQMGVAQTQLREGHRERALEVLEGLRRMCAGKEDLRGFEWYYLHRLCRSPHLVLRGHTSVVTQAIFSPDGNHLATASLDQTIKLWDPTSGQELRTFSGHQRPLRHIAFSPDSKLLASAGADGLICVWDVGTGKKLHTLQGHQQAVSSVAFSPASSDNSLLASASADQTVRVWSLKSGKLLRELKGHGYPVLAVAFRPDGQQLASAGEDALVKLWRWPEGDEENSFKGHSHWVSCLAYSKDGKLLASGSWDQTIRLWDLQGRKAPVILAGHQSPLRNLAYSPDGYKLASCCTSGGVRVWDLRSATEVHQFPPNPEVVRTVAFSPDGQLLASLSFDRRVVDQTPAYTGHDSGVCSVACLPGGLAASAGGSHNPKSGGVEGEVKLWRVGNRETRLTLRPFPRLVRSVAVSADGQLLAAGGEDSVVRLLEATTGKEVQTWAGHERRVRVVLFVPGAHLLASAGEDGKIHLWQREDSAPARTLQGHVGPVHALACHPASKLLASAGADNTIRLWDLTTGKELQRLLGHSDAVNCLAFHKDGKLLASGSDDQTIKLWDLTTGKAVTLSGHSEAVTACSFSPDGKRLASGAEDHTVKVWDPFVGHATLTLHGHNQGVTSVVFSPDGQRLLSASWDHTVRVWEAGT